MSIKRGLEEHRDFVLVLLVAAVAVSSVYFYSQSTNQTPTEYVLVEYLDELSPEQSGMFTGMAVSRAAPDVYRLLENEPPSHYRSRVKYGCYKRCSCSYADTCQCFYGGCFEVGAADGAAGAEDTEKTSEAVAAVARASEAGIQPVQPSEPEPYESVGTKRLNYMMEGRHRRFYGPD